MRNKFKRSSAFVVAVSLLFGLSMAVEANARPAICGKLERQLASAGSASSGGSNKYSRAAQAQIEQLRIAKSQARNAGCGGSFLSLGGNSNKAACARINNTIQRMESNLSKLQSKAGGGTAKPNRARILAALDANDCNGRVINETVAKRKLPSETKSKQPGFLTILFGGNQKPKKIETTYEVASAQNPLKEKKRVTVINGGQTSEFAVAPSGRFRTICVRTCDGYYFPVSFSTSSSRFAVDESACSAMCPGTETKLYYHSVPDQEPEEMIGMDKEPYTALPTAFKYRRDGLGSVAGCSCQAATAEPTDELAAAGTDKKQSKWIPYPTSKPILLDDEETRVNRAGDLDATAIQDLLAVKLSNQTLASQQNIRVVGPVFLPAQSKATDLQVPDQSSVQ